jgi:hypothetical protein
MEEEGVLPLEKSAEIVRELDEDYSVLADDNAEIVMETEIQVCQKETEIQVCRKETEIQVCQKETEIQVCQKVISDASKFIRMVGQEIGLERGTATFHKIRPPSSFLQKRALFYRSL